MCILITKQRGAEFPPLEYIINSVTNNPDGFSMAYNVRGTLVTFKTMSAARFVARYKALAAVLDPEQTGMIIHARIMTHGAKGLRNCHCWKSFAGTDNELAFAHNGILSVLDRDGMTDSETFLRDWFEPAFMAGGWRRATAVITRKIGSSKFAFIDCEGNIRSFGRFVDEDGCGYSNTSYLVGRARFADPRLWTSKPLAI